jgi:hypothetical protein
LSAGEKNPVALFAAEVAQLSALTQSMQIQIRCYERMIDHLRGQIERAIELRGEFEAFANIQAEKDAAARRARQ